MNNDRFKFRAWHKPTKRLFKVWSFTPEYVFENDEVNGIGSPTNQASMDDCVLEQCTGLKDKNGNLIYEGDIVDAYDLDRGVVDWVKSQYQIIRCQSKLPIILKSEMFVEIIGNVHENMDLLEGNAYGKPCGNNDKE